MSQVVHLNALLPGGALPSQLSPPAPGRWFLSYEDRFASWRNSIWTLNAYPWHLNRAASTNEGNEKERAVYEGGKNITFKDTGLALSLSKRDTPYPWKRADGTVKMLDWTGALLQSAPNDQRAGLLIYPDTYIDVDMCIPRHGWGGVWILPLKHANRRFAWGWELDLEYFGGDSGAMTTNLHWIVNSDHAQDQQTYMDYDYAAGYHRWGILWGQESVTYYRDGYAVKTHDRAPLDAGYLIINIAARTTTPDDAPTQTFNVRHLQVWRKF